MLSVVLLGTGNVAQHLHRVFFKAKEVTLRQVYGRNREQLRYFARQSAVTDSLKDLEVADLYILAVSDRAIAPMAQLLNNKDGLVAHTSGSVSIQSLPQERRGVFYPLQTFTKGKKVDFSEIPIGIEAENATDMRLLHNLAQAIGSKSHDINSKQREKLHLSAVLVNNFTNHLYHLASEICKANHIPFHLLLPLIRETTDKVAHLSPYDAQTGPARRNDNVTMQHHLGELSDPLQQKIYQLISESIKVLYEKEL